MLLHCDGFNVLPLIVTGSNGEPVATIALPPVHSYASCGVISHDDVGLDKGKTIGRSCASAIARIAPSEIVPRLPDRPKINCGFSLLTASSSDMPSGRSLDAYVMTSSVCPLRAVPIRPSLSNTIKLAAAASYPPGQPASTIAVCNA